MMDIDIVRQLVKKLSGGAEPSLECGLHSGIPLCCIVHYFLSMGDDKLMRELELHVEAEIGRTIGYRACPACLINRNFVYVLKPCWCKWGELAMLMHRHEIQERAKSANEIFTDKMIEKYGTLPSSNGKV